MNTPWTKIVKFFVENKLIVAVLMSMLTLAGIAAVPFDYESDLPRDPVPVDAIPDIGENQQIVFTKWDGRSPRDIEDQITYPLTTALLGVPGVKTVRSFSMFGFSSIYVIFNDTTEFYWSRSRILEKLNSLPPGTLPKGVNAALGPDATALGQVFMYTLEGRDKDGNTVGGWDLHELRTIQDWNVRYALQAVSGVSEVASIGGYEQEYQVDLDPDAMRAHDVTLKQVLNAVRGSNLDVGARTMEINRIEYVIRGVGFIEDLEDIEATVVVARENTPIRIRDVARVTLGPANRRGALDYGGAETVGGVVAARYGENPMAAIKRVKKKLAEIAPSLPKRVLEDGTVSQVTVVPFYDRSTLINETLGTLSTALWQQILITIIVVLMMLRNLKTSIMISSLLPLAVLGSFVVMKFTGVDANVMSLAGIAIAIGTMVDMGIVITENIIQMLEDPALEHLSRVERISLGAGEVAPAVFTSMLTTVVSFLPVFGLTGAEHKLFSPLAFTKTYALMMSMLLAVVLLPSLAHILLWPEAKATQGLTWFRSLMRPEHSRDWIVIGLGIVVAIKWSLGVGLFVVFVAVLRLLTPILPEKVGNQFPLLESTVATIAMTWLLTQDWLPLGIEAGFTTNFIAVAVSVGGLLGFFVIFQHGYNHMLGWCLRNKAVFFLMPGIIMIVGGTAWLGFDKVFSWLPQSIRMQPAVVSLVHKFPGFGREFMPSFDEGQFLYMPTTMPHASIGDALRLLSETDAAIQAIPEVKEAVGKIGRFESPLDPAPVSMYEIVITYLPEYRTEPDGSKVRQWRDHIRTPDDIWKEITAAAARPGLTSAPKLMPLNTRIIMLQSGMRASLGIKVRGPDLESIEKTGLAMETFLKQVSAISAPTVFAERIVGKPYLEIIIDREAIGRYGLTINDVQNVLQYAVGGDTLTRTVEGRERYGVRVRYMREERDNVESLRRIPIPTKNGEPVPLELIAKIEYVRGPQTIKSEDTFLTGYVTFDGVGGVSENELVDLVRNYLEEKVESGELVLPDGVSYTFAGTYENQVRSEKRLMVLIPIALILIFLILYMQFQRTWVTVVIYSSVAVAVSGGFGLMWLYAQPWFMDFTVFDTHMRTLFQIHPTNLSVAVWVGFIALIGIATDDGVVMATYLQQIFERRKPNTIVEVRENIVFAAGRRIRPCLMTTATTILALLPVITSTGRGSDVMVPMAIPAVGGMSIELVTLFVVPVFWSAIEETRLRIRLWRERRELARGEDALA